MTHLLFFGLSLVLVASGLSAQSLDDKVRITLSFARLLADSTFPRRPVVFVLPIGAPDKPSIDSLLQRLRPAFQRAGLNAISQERVPSGDTVFVEIGGPSVSREAIGTFYTLFYTRRFRTPECIRKEIYAVRLHCTVQNCQFFSESPVGAGEPIECRRP